MHLLIPPIALIADILSPNEDGFVNHFMALPTTPQVKEQFPISSKSDINQMASSASTLHTLSLMFSKIAIEFIIHWSA